MRRRLVATLHLQHALQASKRGPGTMAGSKCSAITQAGKPCSFTTKAGGLCGTHARQLEAPGKLVPAQLDCSPAPTSADSEESTDTSCYGGPAPHSRSTESPRSQDSSASSASAAGAVHVMASVGQKAKSSNAAATKDASGAASTASVPSGTPSQDTFKL